MGRKRRFIDDETIHPIVTMALLQSNPKSETESAIAVMQTGLAVIINVSSLFSSLLRDEKNEVNVLQLKPTDILSKAGIKIE
ncbi:hypothetical protein OHAE_4735 [Ochrobactrum soli]|uniref:Uncharacterized protein n=1 Tax=Ochrobactrum soli TaxID=2448455 RepID=A0A2P9HCY0_9HYPH|nr:hypothetical protein OHAE_4735 [[Ochrobactrum] soli]